MFNLDSSYGGRMFVFVPGGGSPSGPTYSSWEQERGFDSAVLWKRFKAHFNDLLCKKIKCINLIK